MIPEIIQRRGAVHLADDESSASGPVVPDAILELVPESVARENLILPLSLDGETLTCAAVKPDNVHLRDKLTFLVNKRIRFVPMPASVILAGINRGYGLAETESVDSMLMELTDTVITSGEVAKQQVRGDRSHVARERLLGRSEIEFKKGFAGDHLGEASIASLASRVTFAQPGEDTTPNYGSDGMWYYVVEEGQRALMTRWDGRMEVVVGPQRVWKGWNRFERMRHFTAHPGDFLVVKHRDGRQDHIAGPTDVWFDPRIHEEITRQEALQLAAKEAVIVYTRAAADGPIARRIVYGPTLFVPAPGEWLHTFNWHGSHGGSQGAKKVSKGLVFQKLWLMPDQMYHDVPDVRTADDAVLTIRLMIFFELIDIERMLDATHDPIGDFINAATSDVVDFTGRRTFEAFKQETSHLNELDTYRQLTARAAQDGYRVNKVVYRGYGAPDRLQAMHDQAIEARTKLQLERATEQQAQELEDYKLNAQMIRATRRRSEQSIEVDSELELARKRQEAELRKLESERAAARDHRLKDADAQQEVHRRDEERTRQHLSALKEMGVDLTAFLTQSRADRVIELRGGNGKTHVHLDRENG